MIRSMSTAVTGLRGHQQKLDVIGNNIANVNTVAFKKSQARFEDLLSQTIQGATAPQDRGGINPSQVGMGMRMSSITDIHSQGAIMNTDRATDLAIEGDGFFIVTDGSGARYYTRDGSFGLDSNGDLVNSNGMLVSNRDGDTYRVPLGDEMEARATQNLRFAGNLDARVNPTYSLFRDATAGTFIIETAQGNTAAIAYDASAADIQAALEAVAGIESVSVTGLGTRNNPFIIVFHETDPPNQAIDMAINDAGLTGDITSSPAGYNYEYYVYDSLGHRYSVDFAFTRLDLNEWGYEVSVFDENGNQLPVTGGGSGVLQFTTGGVLDPSTVVEAVEFAPAGSDPMVVIPDFGSVTQLAGMNSLLIRQQDGFGAGTLVAFYISRTGMIVGTYTNGMVENLGQIETATFANPEGLAKLGGNLFSETANSGDPEYGNPGEGGRGLISSSALEMSNVDLAYEFTELITTSRAFQANTRVVTTSDEVLVEVVNMKR